MHIAQFKLQISNDRRNGQGNFIFLLNELFAHKMRSRLKSFPSFGALSARCHTEWSANQTEQLFCVPWPTNKATPSILAAIHQSDEAVLLKEPSARLPSFVEQTSIFR